MNEETIKFFRDIEKLENKLTGEDKEILEKEMYMFNECARILEETERENQRLKERIEYLQRSISRKEETIRNLRNELVETPKESELENRINKALEHIDECCWYPDCNNYSNMCDYEVKELLKILKGENND